MPDSRLAWLYMVDHQGETGLVHCSVVATLARSRFKVWIPRGRNLAKKVVLSCARCAKDKKVLLEQQMGTVRHEQATV